MCVYINKCVCVCVCACLTYMFDRPKGLRLAGGVRNAVLSTKQIVVINKASVGQQSGW